MAEILGPTETSVWAMPGIEIYLPISRSLAVAMWEQSVLEELEQQLATAKKELNPFSDPEGVADRAGAELASRLEKIRGGATVVASRDNVMFVNSLQVMYASRFVMSSVKDFSLVQRMILDDVKFRSGTRMQVG